MPRPPLADPAQRRTVQLALWATPQEAAPLIEAAAEHGLSRSDFLRRLVLGRRLPKQRLPRIEQELLAEVRRLGNNLNQAVAAIHRGAAPQGFLPSTRDLQRLLAEVRDRLTRSDP